MGGYGSGRGGAWHSKKDTTDSYRQLDVRALQRRGLLATGRDFTWQWSRQGEVVASIRVRSEAGGVWLSYRFSRNDSPWQEKNYFIQIEWTHCYYGGHRAWFRCPAANCGRRVAILYLNGIFACRHCCQLSYESQQEPPHGRALLKAQKIRMKLGGTGSMADPFPPKPKRMRWRTYYSYVAMEEEADSRAVPPFLLRMFTSQS